MKEQLDRPTISGGLALWLLLLVTGVVLPASIGCTADKSDAAEIPGADAAPQIDERIAVAAIPLSRGSIESVLHFSSNLEAESAVEVYAEASRKVTELRVEEGSRVRRGQLLVRLESDEQRSSVAKVTSQLERARREYDRQKRLYEQELISEKAFSDATYELEQLEIALADAERDLSYTEVTAPISGIVTQRLVDVGDHVQMGAHLFDIVDFNTIVAKIFVPEKEVARLAPGQEARISTQAGGAAREAVIDRIAPVVDPRSGTVKVTLRVPPQKGLVPGMYVEVDLVADTVSDALLVPKRALVWDQDQTFVYQVDDDKRVERRMIEAVLENADLISVSDEVLAEGDLVVIAGQAGLKEGAEVRLLDLDDAIDAFAGQ